MEPYRNETPDFYVLVKEAVNGNSTSFQNIYDLIAGKMYSLCLRYAGNKTDANDWFQDAFLKLINNLHAFKGEGSFEGWARKIFISTCLDHLKKKAIPISPIDSYDGINDPDPGIYSKLNNEDLMQIISLLPDAARLIVNLSLVEGYSHKEISELIQISEEGCRSQLFRARVLLKKIIAAQYASK